MGVKRKGKAPKKEFKKLPLNRAFTKLLEPVFANISYTPQELWYKFTQYIERSDKNGEEITISGFSVFANIERHYMQQHKTSKDFSSIISRMYNVFEGRYEQKIAKGENLAYLLNNRFRGERESLTKSEDKLKVEEDVRDSLDYIIKKNKKN